MSLFHRALYLTGATAVGKTAVGVCLAQAIGAEVVSMDSMTLYRGMDIGTAKPTLEERRGVRHHLIDVLDAWESASVAQYREWAGAVLEDLHRRGVPALFVGGTPLYLKALLRGLFPSPGADSDLRSRLEKEATDHGDLALHERLARYDKATADRLHPNDRRRVIRALEVMEMTGKPLSEWQTEHERPAEGVCVVALQRERAELHRRIEGRVLEMFQKGFEGEVRMLLEGPRPPSTVAMQGVGYLEVAALLEGRVGWEETIARVQARTRQFAKRQETWFRGLKEVEGFAVEQDESPETTARRVMEQWEMHCKMRQEG